MALNGMDEFLSGRIKENAALFSSVPFEMAENLAGWAAQRALQGGTADKVAKEMEGMVLGATKAKFTLIARTEMSKTKSAVTEFKSLRLKVPAYIWKASGGGRGDGRTRHSHKGMADVIVFWDDAPAPEDLFPMKTKDGRPYRNTLGHYHCGCCPNCRCTPMPLVFAEDLKFPVRVYTNGKIIRMNQRDFDRLYREKSGKLGKPLPRVNEEKPRVSLVSDEMTSEELSRKAKEQKRDDKGRFSREGNTGQKNQEERKEPEEQKEDIFYIDQLKEIENCKALYSVDEMQEFEDKKKKRTNERIQYDKYWCEANLEDTVKQFLPNAIREPVNKNGKIYYLNDSNIIIDYDVFGDYFRIFDKTKKIKKAN